MTSLEHYAGRALSGTEYPEVIIVIKLPAIGAAKGPRKYPLHCRNNLVAHRPWTDHVFDAGRDLEW